MQLFSRKGKEAPKRDETMSSRYLDASPEDAILGRSLRQKSANDDYLRCTEFDCEGVALFMRAFFQFFFSFFSVFFLSFLSFF